MTKSLAFIGAIALSTAMASCSLFSNKGTVARVENTSQAEEPALDVQAPIAPGAQSTPVQLPAKTAPATVASPLFGRLNGEWVIVGVGNHTINRDEDMPYINFEESAGRFYASNGCNILNGSYSLDDNKIAFSQVLSTMKSCPDVAFETSITRVLSDGVSVKVQIENKGREEYLQLTNHSGQKLLTLKRHNMEILNGQWIVTEIDGTKIDNPEVNLFIDIPELKVHGNTGCNYFNGSILIDPAMSNSIQFAQMAVTMRLCENAETERAYLVALEMVQSFKTEGNFSILKLINDKGRTVITLKRAPIA